MCFSFPGEVLRLLLWPYDIWALLQGSLHMNLKQNKSKKGKRRRGRGFGWGKVGGAVSSLLVQIL